MRRHPTRLPFGEPPKPQTIGKPQALELGDAQEAWLVSGGWLFHPAYGEGFTTAPGGYQLLAAKFVPPGNVGWLKQLRVAPFMPSELAQPWVTSGVVGGQGSWVGQDAGGDLYPRPAGQNGVWTTPFGWEGYFDAVAGATPPSWRWQLTLVQGDVNAIRAGMPPYSVADPLSWQFVPDIPVPPSAYPQGVPGVAPGRTMGAQRMQVVQADELTHHVMIPENMSLCLWAWWTQGLYTPRGVDENGDIVYGYDTYPLLPSFGQLSGYMQSLSSRYIEHPAASVINARHGWQG
jgi:hypothetical protein